MGRQRRAAQPLCGNLGGISRLDSGRDFLSRIWARSPSCFGRAHLFRGMAKQPRMEPSTTTLCPIYRPCLHNAATFLLGKHTRTARARHPPARARTHAMMTRTCTGAAMHVATVLLPCKLLRHVAQQLHTRSRCQRHQRHRCGGPHTPLWWTLCWMVAGMCACALGGGLIRRVINGNLCH